MKKNKLSKTTKIFLLSGALVVGAGAAATTTILLVNKKADIKYQFDNQIFDNKKQIFDYAYAQAKNTNYDFENLKFLIDDKAFNTKHELEEYISQNYPIKSVSTIKDPSPYLINSAGELSPLVLTNNGEKGIDVYKGINGEAYSLRDSALASYLNSFEEKYLINGSMFDNLYSAKNYYEENMLERLEKMEPIHIYKRGGIQYEEQEIKSWLRNTIKRGFQYKGQPFSDYSYDEFLDAMKNLDKSVLDDNILPVRDADKSSFWVSFSSPNPLGYFIGPRYIESNEASQGSIRFDVTDEQDGNAILDIFKVMALGSLVDSSVGDRISSELKWTKGTSFIAYLTNIFSDKSLGLDKTTLDGFNSIFSTFGQALRDDAAASLDGIKDDEGLTDFHKVLVVFKRLLTSAKIYDLPNASGDNYKNFENSVKKVVVELLKTQKDLMAQLFNGGEIKDWSTIFLSDDLSFETIYNLFLNTQAFYEDGGEIGSKIRGIQNAFNVLDDVISTVVNGSGDIGSIIGSIDDLEKESNKSNDKFKEGSSDIQNRAKKSFSSDKNTAKIKDKLKINKITKKSISAFTNIISGAWSLGEMFSFINFVTAEAKIDSNQSIYYFEPCLKLPFVGSGPFRTKVEAKVTELVEAPVKRMIPQGKDGKDIPVYEFNNRYYLDYDTAKAAFIDAIYSNPSKYLPTTALMTSGYGDTWDCEVNLPPICKNDCSEEHEHITQTTYNEAVAKLKEDFVEYLFKRYFKEVPNNTYYPDGFGEFFEKRTEAVANLREKVDKIENYKKVYSYKIKDQIIIKTSLEEIIDFIKNNQLIETKKVINTDLITTMVFDKLNDYFGQTYQIYELLFYGTHKYFRTKLEAENFLKNNLNWKPLIYSDTINTYEYLDWNFMSKKGFDNWIESRITEEK